MNWKRCISSLLVVLVIIIFISNRKEIVIDMNKIINDSRVINCKVFDGTSIIGNTSITLNNGNLTSKDFIIDDDIKDTKYFIMPGLADYHTHTGSKYKSYLDNGITTIYDVKSNKKKYDNIDIYTSMGIIMPGVDNGISTAGDLAKSADYIKVMVDMPYILGGKLIKEEVLKDIVSTAHKYNLKVAAHTTSLKAVKLAVSTNVDILIHVPLDEEFPSNLAKDIADKGIVVIPTLVMMKEFANSPFYGYKKEDYKYAKDAVKKLYSYGVKILVGTDSNSALYVPSVSHGKSLFDEMELLVDAGMEPTDVLKGANSTNDAFGTKSDNKVWVLIEGNPDKNIGDVRNIRQVWINGDALFK